MCSIPETETWETQELERKLRSVIREFFSKAAEFQSSGKRNVSSARNQNGKKDIGHRQFAGIYPRKRILHIT